ALEGTDTAPDATGRAQVYLTGTGQLLVITVWNMPPLADGRHVYQAWLVDENRRTSAGVFRVDPMGRGTVIYRAGPDVRFDGIGVTLEPDPYGESPRGQRILAGSGEQPR
ncbi:MAG: anti-sigma factor, partial [Thermaerobacterales bacterium]